MSETIAFLIGFVFIGGWFAAYNRGYENGKAEAERESDARRDLIMRRVMDNLPPSQSSR